jgi:hypothetical protein
MDRKYRILLTGFDGFNSPIATDKVFTGPNGIQYRDDDGYENFVPYRRVFSIHWKEAATVVEHPSSPDFTPRPALVPDPRAEFFDPMDTGDPERTSLEMQEPLDQDPMA